MTTRPGTQQPQAFTRTITKRVGAEYLFYQPAGYDPAGPARWPLILFLHGRGERGANLALVKRHGLAKVLEADPAFPALVVSPQCPLDHWGWDVDMLGALLDSVTAQHAVDPDRVYVTGLSMGGRGTWALALATPERFAAIAPICGGGEPALACALAQLPIWAFHGARDDVVPVQESERIVAAVRACGGHVRFTVYPDLDHDSWTVTYANPALYTWLLAQRRGHPATDTPSPR